MFRFKIMNGSGIVFRSPVGRDRTGSASVKSYRPACRNNKKIRFAFSTPFRKGAQHLRGYFLPLRRNTSGS
jgi:hypothetical protein